MGHDIDGEATEDNSVWGISLSAGGRMVTMVLIIMMVMVIVQDMSVFSMNLLRTQKVGSEAADDYSSKGVSRHNNIFLISHWWCFIPLRHWCFYFSHSSLFRSNCHLYEYLIKTNTTKY